MYFIFIIVEQILTPYVHQAWNDRVGKGGGGSIYHCLCRIEGCGIDKVMLKCGFNTVIWACGTSDKNSYL